MRLIHPLAVASNLMRSLSEAYVPLPLLLPSPNALDGRRAPLTPRLLSPVPCQDASDKGLKCFDPVNGFKISSAVILGAQVLLDHDGSFVEPVRAQVLEEGEHAGAEEDFGQPELIFVGAVVLCTPSALRRMAMAMSRISVVHCVDLISM